MVQTPNIPLGNPSSSPLYNPLYNYLEGVLTVAHMAGLPAGWAALESDGASMQPRA